MRLTTVVFRCGKCGTRIETKEWEMYCETCDRPMRLAPSVWIKG